MLSNTKQPSKNKDCKSDKLQVSQKLIKTFQFDHTIDQVTLSSTGILVFQYRDLLYTYNPVTNIQSSPITTDCGYPFSFALPNGKILLNREVYDPIAHSLSNIRNVFPYFFDNEEAIPYILDPEHIIINIRSYHTVDIVNINTWERKTIDLKRNDDAQNAWLRLLPLNNNKIATLSLSPGSGKNPKLRIYKHSDNFNLTLLNEAEISDDNDSFSSVLPNNYFITISRDHPNQSFRVWNPETLKFIRITQLPIDIDDDKGCHLLADGLTMVFHLSSQESETLNTEIKFLSFNLNSLELSPFSVVEQLPQNPNCINAGFLKPIPNSQGQFYLFKNRGWINKGDLKFDKNTDTLSLITLPNIELQRQKFFIDLMEMLITFNFPKVLTIIVNAYLADYFPVNLTNPNGFFAKYGNNMNNQDIQAITHNAEHPQKKQKLIK